jgi:Icc-related predicted phosphoesterase|tara:strand:+ start:171 stop:773 length:603 start_codon:yes stop_codon:yes gene_type:complete
MKLLAFVDVHSSLNAIKKIAEKAKKSKPDLLICAGDISVFEQGLDYLLHKLNKINIPLLIIPGNHESEEELEKSTSLFKNINHIHNKHFEKGNYIFFGYGGGGFSLIDPEFRKLGKKFEEKIKKSKSKKVILITHAPPYNTKTDKIMKKSCGNKTIRQFIDKVKPDLVITGHLHENAGKEDKVGKTKIINPGPYGKIVEV